MKYIIAIFFTAINCIANTNSVVVFSKETADGGKLKVEFRSLPFEVIRTTNANAINITSHIPKKITPSTKWEHIYTIVTTDGTGEHQLPYGTMLKARDGATETIKIIDAQSEGRTAVFLYKYPTGISNQCLFAHLTGKISLATNSQVAFGMASVGHIPSKEERVRLERERALQDADPFVGEFLIWAPSQSEHSELKSARITGSRANSNLVVEVTYALGKFQKCQTNCFVNDKWIVSESQFIPLSESK
jgi:hypothetical protein